jgi:hypothetical protein
MPRARKAATTVLLGAGLMVGVTGSAQAQERSAAAATIDVTRSAGGILVSGGALALTDGAFKALMTIDKAGKSGSMKTTQGGDLALKAGESGEIARVGLSYEPGDTLEITLDVSAGGQTVSRTHTVLK